MDNLNNIKECIDNLLYTSKGSVPFAPEFGTNIHLYIHMPVNIAEPLLKKEIITGINTYEKRVRINKINSYYVYNSLIFTITLFYERTGEVFDIEYKFSEALELSQNQEVHAYEEPAFKIKQEIPINTWQLNEEDSIKECIANILFTEKGSLPFNPEFGTNIHSLMDLPLDVVLSQLTSEVISGINSFEKRITLKNIQVYNEFDRLFVKITTELNRNRKQQEIILQLIS